MTTQEALKILMLSPVYFRLGIPQRKQLIKDYCRLYAEIHHRQEMRAKHRS
jgi:hypothetical protein